MIDGAGYKTHRVPSTTPDELLVMYGQARHLSVARIAALFETIRAVEGSDRPNKRLSVTPAGALWQAYKGNDTDNACHTAPALLLPGGKLPTLITRNRGLQRHLIIEFADCMLIPKSVNSIDKVVDDRAGRDAFAMMGEMMLNERGATWRDGRDLFAEEMRGMFGFIADAMGKMHPYEPSDPSSRERLEAVFAYYQGLYLHTPTDIEIGNFQTAVTAEAALEEKLREKT
jgi:hypothetical protein